MNLVSDQLQEIKARMNKAIENEAVGYVIKISDVAYLIEQLEQAQQENVKHLAELESLANVLADIHVMNQAISDKNQKLIEALEWYTQRKDRAYWNDGGSHARQALKEVQHGTSKD